MLEKLWDLMVLRDFGLKEIRIGDGGNCFLVMLTTRILLFEITLAIHMESWKSNWLKSKFTCLTELLKNALVYLAIRD